jgi:hypothetical protein
MKVELNPEELRLIVDALDGRFLPIIFLDPCFRGGRA